MGEQRFKDGDNIMTKKSKKEKAAGREKHRLALREKKMKKSNCCFLFI